MSEDLSTLFTTEQILAGTKMNLAGAWLGTIAYLKEQHLSPLDWSVGLGKQFAPGWEELKGRGAREAAQLAALSLFTLGGVLISFEGDESSAEFVGTGWPDAGGLQYYQVTQADADVVWECLVPIAAFLDLRYHWQREDDCIRVTFSR